MRKSIFEFPAKSSSGLLLGALLLSTLGCAMFEEDAPPKYTRNSPSSITRHAPPPSDTASDPNSFLRQQRPQPTKD